MRIASCCLALLVVAASTASAATSHAVFAYSNNGTEVTELVLVDTSNTTYVLRQTDRGWYNENGSHTPSNTNYIVGFGGSSDECNCGDLYYNNFFVFEVPNATFVSASLRLEVPSPNGYISPEASLDYLTYDVTTNINALVGGTGGVAAYNDLGSGVYYGGRTYTNADEGTVPSFALNAAALASINGAAGGLWAVGGTVVPIPEPASLALVGLGLVTVAAKIRRRRTA